MNQGDRYWLIRVAIADKPGALAALATTLSVHDVNLLRIDVVSRDAVAVDDLWVELPEGGRIDSLEPVLRRLPGVSVLAMVGRTPPDDPVDVMAAAAASLVCAATVEETLRRGLEGVCLVARAQHAALLQAGDGGALHVLAKTFDGPERIEAHEFSLARDALREGVALNVPGSYPWAPPSWLMATRAAAVVALPVASSAGIYGCLTIARSYPMSFEGGELARITALAGVMTAALSARGFETAITPAGLPGLAEPAELAMATS